MYIGQTYKIPLGNGWNANPDYDQLEPTALTDINNINLHKGGLQPRGGCELVNVDNLVPYYTENLGLSWQMIPITGTYYEAIVYGNGVWIATGSGTTLRSDDGGLTWTSFSFGGVSVAYANGVWIIVGSGSIYRSIDDGESWNTITPPEANSWTSVAYGNSVWIAVSNTGTNRVMRSTDNGLTWATVSVTAAPWFSIKYGNSVWIAAGGASSTEIMRSVNDGVSWTNIAAPEAGTYYSIDYGNSVWIAISSNGANRIIRSVDNGLTWSIITPVSLLANKAVAYGNGVWMIATYGETYFLRSMGLQDNTIKGIAQYIPQSGEITGSYITDESGNNIIDEYGNLIISEGSDIIACTADGNIWKNYDILLKSGLTINLNYNFEYFYGKLFITNKIDYPQVYENQYSYTYDMGSPPKCTAVLGSGAGSLSNGAYSYKITFVTASGESTGGTVSDTVTVIAYGTNGKINLSNIPLGLSACTARKIYRTKAGGTTYYLVTTITDNTTTSYIDNTADSALTSTISDETDDESLAFLPTDWVTGFPSHFMMHTINNQQRMWAWGCEGYPNRLYASANGEEDFSDTNVIVISLTCPKIIGMVESFGKLLVFSQEQTFIVDASALTVSNWGFQSAIWKGGAANHNLIVKTPTDVMVMSPEGNIFSIAASEKYGDYEIASLSKPVFINEWIKNNIDLTKLENFFAKYDPEIRAVKIFMVPLGETSPTLCLVYFIDKSLKGWSKHTFDVSHNCSAVIKVSEENWKIYTGGGDGKIYQLESLTLRDDGERYESSFSTIPIVFDNPRNEKQFDRVWTVQKPMGTESLAIDVLIDNRALTTQYIIMTGADTILNNFECFIGATGRREQITITNSDGNNYFLSQLLLDYQDLGGQ